MHGDFEGIERGANQSKELFKKVDMCIGYVKYKASIILDECGFIDEHCCIQRVLRSCETSQQRAVTYSWAIKSLNGSLEMICRKHPLLRRELNRQAKPLIRNLSEFV